MSTVSDIAAIVSAAAPVAKALHDVVRGEGSREEAARSLVAAALDLVPEEELRQYLTDAARARAEAAFAIARAIKLGET